MRQHIASAWRELVRLLLNETALLQERTHAEIYRITEICITTGLLPSELVQAVKEYRQPISHPLEPLNIVYLMWLNALFANPTQMEAYAVQSKLTSLPAALGSLRLKYGKMPAVQPDQEIVSKPALFVKSLLDDVISIKPDSRLRSVLQTEYPMPLAVYLHFYYEFAYDTRLYEPTAAARYAVIKSLQSWISQLENPLSAFDYIMLTPTPVKSPFKLRELVVLDEGQDDDS